MKFTTEERQKFKHKHKFMSVEEASKEFSNSPTKHQDCEPETLEELCERLGIDMEII